MNIIQRIKDIADARGMTLYDLSKRCGFSNNTVYRWYSKNFTPKLESLNIVCEKGFGMPLGEFLAEDCETIPVTPKVKEAVMLWTELSDEQCELVKNYINYIKHNCGQNR